MPTHTGRWPSLLADRLDADHFESELLLVCPQRQIEVGIARQEFHVIQGQFLAAIRDPGKWQFPPIFPPFSLWKTCQEARTGEPTLTRTAALTAWLENRRLVGRSR
jgi:hypothetical protein